MSGGEHPETFQTQAEFASSQPKEGSPETEFRRTPNRTFLRKFFNRRLRFPDGAEFDVWGFEDATSGRGLPSPLARVTEGDIVHCTLEASKRSHTIHWHGIEPDPRNDGAGHTSFEITGRYTYQFNLQRGVPGDPNSGTAGSYFYHCHVNTVLHVQMGMFGPIVIDPVVHPDFPVLPGARRAFVDGPLYDVATEAFIAAYPVDPRWHTMNHAAGLSGEDVGLNRFEPKHFYALGGALAQRPRRGGVATVSQLRVNVAGRTFPSLVRFVNASYFPTKMRFTDAADRPLAFAEVIAHDGRPFRDTSDPAGPSRPVRDMEHPLLTSFLGFGAAERYDVLVHPPVAGEFRIHIDWHDWVTGAVLGTRVVRLMAS